MTEQSLLTGFSAFTSGLQRVLCGSSMVYTRDLGISGLLILDLSTINLPTLSVFLDVEDGTCGMWKGMLTEATMTDHFENECNIYEDSGLGALAGIFATALQGNITTEKLQSGNILSLNLEYDFGSKIRADNLIPKVSTDQDDLTEATADVGSSTIVSGAQPIAKKKPKKRVGGTELFPGARKFKST